TVERGRIAGAAAGDSARHAVDARARRALVGGPCAAGCGLPAGRGGVVVPGSTPGPRDPSAARPSWAYVLNPRPSSGGCDVGAKRSRKIVQTTRERASQEGFSRSIARIQIRALHDQQPDHLVPARHLRIEREDERISERVARADQRWIGTQKGGDPL